MALATIHEILDRHVTAAPDRPMITCGPRTVSREEFHLRTNQLARRFAALGVARDTLVTIALPNSIDLYEAAVAAWKIGATPQPVSSRLPAVELEAIVRLANPSLVVGGPTGLEAPRIAAQDLAADDFSDQPLAPIAASYWKAPTSGGSTGRPKLIVARAPALFDPDGPFMEMKLDQTQLVPGALYHNAPFSLSLIGLTRGHHLVVMPKFDPLETLTLIDRHRVGWILLVPTMMSRIWRLATETRARFDTSSIETIWHMAAPCPVWLKEAWIEWIGGEKIWELYGGTEGQGITTIRGDEWLSHKGSVGRPLEPFDMCVLDEEGRPQPPGTVGEVFMRPKAGQGTTYHYVGATPKANPEGFESLGDMGWFDADGYLYLADRQSDMILVGGANVYPAEVEGAIEQHPLVRSCAVIGLPDDDLGNTVHAIVEADPALDAPTLLAFLRERIALYKSPRTVEFVDAPLRDDAGKVRRSALRAARIAAG
jgi:bile acid-coenzyme A ligase